MFSSFLPNASSSMKLAQNGPSKQSNRFSVRVFKTQTNLPFTYPVTAKPDLSSYRPPPQREQQNSTWYPPSNGYPSYDTRPRNTTDYAIYPSATDGTFIYEQSTCSKSDIFSNSELDAASTATFSPAMSTDSTITLPSTNAGERSTDDLRLGRPATPAARSGYSAHGQGASQAPSMSRATSTSYHVPAESLEDHRARLSVLQARSATPMHPTTSTNGNGSTAQMPPPNAYIGHIPEYAASSMSELEVEERDRIAQINAGYNSTPTASMYSANSGSSNDSDRRRMPTISQNPSMLGRESFGPSASQQPLHPGLHFPTRSQDPEYAQSTFQPNPASFSQNLPLVERISSQLPPDYQTPQAGPQGPSYRHASLPDDQWGRDANPDSEPPRILSYRTSPKNMPQPFEGNVAPSLRSMQSTYGASIQDMPVINEQRQDRPVVPTPSEMPRGRRSSLVGPRPDLNGIRPVSEVRDYGVSSRGPTDYRQAEDLGRRVSDPASSTSKDNLYNEHRDAPNSPPRGQPSSPRDASGRGAEIRRDSRTPLPREFEDHRSNRPSRRNSYIDHNRSTKDMRSKSQSPTDSRAILKSGPLSSSPTQLRASPTEIEPTLSRRGPFLAPPEPELPKERTRTRSISFSHAVRPTLPVQNAGYHTSSSQQPQAVSNMSDARHSSDQERYTRSSDRSPPSKVTDPLRSTTPPDFDLRSDTRTATSQATYYSQVPMPAAGYDFHSQRQSPSGQPAAPSRAMERTTSTMPSQPILQVRGGQTTEISNSRSRTTYPEPAYTQQQPPPQPHAEPVRRHSDGDKPYGSNIVPRGNAPYEKQSSAFKTAGPPGNWPSNVPSAGTASSEPQRRNSDGDQNPPFRPSLSGRNSAPLLRSVRWNDNLICPSPIPTSARRKGWFNRRGDQLWTNDGAYRAAPAGQEYPADLDDYPDHEEGWMNEECVRIDLGHRLIPKPPLRSALKQARN